MIVVSNTSPLINPAAVGELELLEKLYIRIFVPEAVYHEIVVAGAGQPGAEEVRAWPCFEMRVVQDQVLLADLRRELDAGEAEPIALAVESDADLALIDERRGRMVAGRHGVRVLGLLGVLVAAKEQNLLRVIRPIMDRLTSDARFRISDDLYHRVLERAGELWMFPCSMLGCLGERQEGRQPLAAIRTRHHKAIAQTTVRLEYS